MRLSAGLCLLAASASSAAPQKEELPPGAVGRLGTPSRRGSGRRGHRPPLCRRRTRCLSGRDGWNTWDLSEAPAAAGTPGRRAGVRRGPRPDHIFVGSARKLHAIEPRRIGDGRAGPVVGLASDGRSRCWPWPPAGGASSCRRRPQARCPRQPNGRTTGTAEVTGRPLAAALTANGRILAVVTREGRCRGVRPRPRRHARPPLGQAGGPVGPGGHPVLARRPPAGRYLGRACVASRTVTGRPDCHARTQVRRRGRPGDRVLPGRPAASRPAAPVPEPVVRVWSVEDGQELASYFGHRRDVNAVGVRPGRQDPGIGRFGCRRDSLEPPAGVGVAATLMAVTDAWEALDSLDEPARRTGRRGALLADPAAGVAAIRAGFRGRPRRQGQDPAVGRRIWTTTSSASARPPGGA